MKKKLISGFIAGSVLAAVLAVIISNKSIYPETKSQEENVQTHGADSTKVRNRKHADAIQEAPADALQIDPRDMEQPVEGEITLDQAAASNAPNNSPILMFPLPTRKKPLRELGWCRIILLHSSIKWRQAPVLIWKGKRRIQTPHHFYKTGKAKIGEESREFSFDFRGDKLYIWDPADVNKVDQFTDAVQKDPHTEAFQCLFSGNQKMKWSLKTDHYRLEMIFSKEN